MSRYRDVFLFAFLAVAWGGGFIAIEAGLESLPPVFFASLRYDLGALLLVGYAAATRDRWLPRTRDDYLSVLIVGAFFIAANNALLFLGQQHTTGGVAAVLYSMNPVLTAAIAPLLLADERLSRLGVVGFALGLVGVSLVVRPDPGNFLASAVGKLLVLGSASSVAVGSVLLRKTEPTADAVARTGWAMALGSLVMHGLSVARGETATLDISMDALIPLAYLVIFATAAAYVVYFGLLDRHGPVEINLVSYVVPMVAAITGWALRDETLTAATIAGFVVILAGFALIKREALASAWG
ncbi:DMT family transporter [Halorussus halophilus]|uniref:DMT family transporter n=1 Tax=Halorussus halophilus TaxID=2650975 RepID=UPI001300D8BA|nr:DMT family transporter [Halorussus halophilus]